MFTSLKRDQLSSYSKYKVEVNATTIETSSLLNPPNRFIAGIKKGSKVTTAAITVFMMLLVMFLGLIASPAKANAWGVDDIGESVIQMFCTTGATGLQADDKNSFAPKPAPNGTNPTMFEKYGMSGTTFTLWGGFYDADHSITSNKNKGLGTSTSIITATGGNSKESGLSEWEPELEGTRSGLNNLKNECLPGQVGGITATNVIANGTLNVTKFVVWVGNFTYETATSVSASIYNNLEKPLTEIAKTLWSKLYFAYLTPIIMIGAVWLFIHGAVQRKVTTFWQSLIYMVTVVFAAGVAYGNPLGLSVFISSTTTTISQTLTSQLSSVGSDGSGLCDATGKNASVRKFQCNNYYANVYTPFVVGQFGATPKQLTNAKEDNFSTYVGTTKTNKKFNLETLKDTSGNRMKIVNVKLGNNTPAQQNFALYYLDYRSNWDNASYQQKVNKTRAQLTVVAHEVASEDYNRNFRGDNSSERVITSLVALTSSVMTNLLVVIISFAIVILDVMMLLMGIVLPVFALIALHPGQGKQKAIGYLNDLMSMAFKKIALSLFLGIYIVIIQQIQLAVGNGINLGVQIMMVVTLGIVGFKQKDKLVNAWGNWKVGSGESVGFNAQNNANTKGGITSNLLNRAKAGLSGGGSTASTGLSSIGNKSSAINKVVSAGGGAGKKPQLKPGQEDNKANKDSFVGRKPQTKKPSNDETSNAQPTGETPIDNPAHDDSGSGEAPQHKVESDEQSQYSEGFNRSEYENVENGYEDNSGSGEAPQVGTQNNHSNESEATPELTPQQRTKNAKAQAKVQAKAIKAELKANGHRSHVGIGTILGATAKATVVGLATGNTSRAISAGTTTVNRKKQAIQQANAEAVKNVSQKHRDRNYELARQQRQSEFEKAQAKRKAEREANMKRNADERAKRYAGSSNQQGKAQQPNSVGQSPQSKPTTQPAQKVTYQQTEHTSQVSNPATPVSNPVSYVNETQAPRVEQPRNEAPRVETPRYNPPAPQVSKPANYTSEVQAPRVEQPRQTAPRPVREQPRNEAPRVEAPRQTAPQPVREQPRQTAPRVEAPRQTAPQPVREQPKQSVVPPKAQTAKPVIQPRQTPASKQVVKESKPKASNPKPSVSPAKPPAPPVKAPAPSKAKVTAPQPPTPTRRSIRESGNQTPPAPKPPQLRNR